VARPTLLGGRPGCRACEIEDCEAALIGRCTCDSRAFCGSHLAGTQRDADAIADAQSIVDLTEAIRTAARGAETPDLGAFTTARRRLSDSLDRRPAVS
jgi:hypothetical protein